jgi:hypothetical protein
MSRSGLSSIVVALAMVASTGVSARADVRSHGAVTISGRSVSAVELVVAAGGGTAIGGSGSGTLRLGSGSFGADLTADGGSARTPDDVVVRLAAGPGGGACYALPGSVTVRSNRAYDIAVTASSSNERLHLLDAEPVDFQACGFGEPLGPVMSRGSAWIAGQAPTAGRTHGVWIALELRQAEEPAPTLAEVALMFEAHPAL